MQLNFDAPKALCITTPDQMQWLENALRSAEEIAFDTETTGLRYYDTYDKDGSVLYHSTPIFFSLSWDDNGTDQRVLAPIECIAALDEAIADPFKIWLMANAKFDMHMAANRGKCFQGDIVDVSVMHSLLYGEDSHALKYMAHVVLGWSWPEFEDTFGKIPKEGPGPTLLKCFEEDRQRLVEYAANDAYGTYHLYLKLREELKKAYTTSYEYAPNHWKNTDTDPPHTLWDYMFHVEIPFTKVLFDCERNGIFIDQEYLAHLNKALQEDILRVEKELNQKVGRVINTKSSHHLRWALFEHYKLKPFKKTSGGKTGNKMDATDKETLEHYIDFSDHPEAVSFCKLVLELRDLEKTFSTYVQNIYKYCDTQGRIHTFLNQADVRSGRLSSKNPNLH